MPTDSFDVDGSHRFRSLERLDHLLDQACGDRLVREPANLTEPNAVGELAPPRLDLAQRAAREQRRRHIARHDAHADVLEDHLEHELDRAQVRANAERFGIGAIMVTDPVRVRSPFS